MKKLILWVVICVFTAGTPLAAETVSVASADTSSNTETPATSAVMESPPAVESDANVSDGALSSFNRAMHDFNHWMWEGVASGGQWLGFLAPPAAVREAVANLLGNYVNEPLSIISWSIAGDFGNSADAARRIWINTTQGWLGLQDPASAQGVKVPSIDIGLALCARGVGEGSYIVLPFVGPRTVRDGLSDFLLINGITYLALAPAVGFPPSLETFLTVELVEEAGRIAVMRQIDHADDRIASLEEARDTYLASRRERCRQIVDAREQRSIE